MKLIKCHFYNDKDPVYINPEFIELFFEDEFPDNSVATKIITESGSVYVVETPKEIIAQITLASIDKDYSTKTKSRKRKNND